MAFATVAEFVEVLQQTRLLKPIQLDEVTRTLAPQFTEPLVLAKELIRRGWLTVYQVNQLFQKAQAELSLGSYRIMDSLGKGGVSQVYKAWDERRQCLVALKVIYPELMSNAEAFGRFQREMQAVSQLDHPNIVKAFGEDAPIGSAHFYAMEFVEGTDLNKLVQLSGPMPIEQACDCIRQAALALQHAHERGLIHRDIKPANLVLMAGSTQIKILDFGLTRTREPKTQPGPFDIQTMQGVMIGTPDFVSPEQARDPRSVDIRADIYSLGCTFYYLLTGQPPFPGTSFLEKIYKHQTKEPTAVNLLRTEVPETLANVVKKMMAKKLEERFQTPVEVADVLASFCPPERGISVE